MPWLLALGVAAVATYFVMKHHATPVAGKVVPPNALLPGHWYRVTLMINPASLSSPTPAAAQSLVQNEMKAQGWIGALAVIVKQNTDNTIAATGTGPYVGGQGGIANTAAITVLQVEELNPPK